MREVEPDSKWEDEGGSTNGIHIGDESQVTETTAVVSVPNDAELITITLLARLYDLGLALLTHLDQDKANQIYDAHEAGENFNPPLFIPDLKSND